MHRRIKPEHSRISGLIRGISSAKGIAGLELLLESRLIKEHQPIHNKRLRLKQALIPLRLRSWPYPCRIGVREYDESSQRCEVHVFDYWCHLARADSERAWARRSKRASMKFDVDTYKLLLKYLGKQTEIFRLG